MATSSPEAASAEVSHDRSASRFASSLGLMSPSQTKNSKNDRNETGSLSIHQEPGSSNSVLGSDLDPEYLSHIQSVVSKTGFTSPQQIYETISSMSKDDAVQSQPSVFNMPTNPTIPPLSTSKSASANQLESFLSIPILPSSKDRGRRVELTLQEKVDLIQHSKGKSQRALAEIFGVGKSQVNLILKRKDEIISMYAKGGHLDRKRLRLRADKDEINSLTLEWFMKEYKNNAVTLSGPLVQEKAKEFAAKLGRSEFRASNGWLHSFCKRNNIGFNSKQGLYVKETLPDSSWPSQVMGGTESWADDGGFDLGQEEDEEEEAAQSEASDDNSEEKLENTPKEVKSCQEQEPSKLSQQHKKKADPSCSASNDRTPPPGKKFKRCELNLLEKVELLHQHSAGKPEKELSKMFGVGRSQVYSTLKRKAEILEAYERLGNTNRKRLHSRAESDEINQLTWHWFKEIAKLNSVQISGPMLQAKAKEFANQLGRDDFKASNGWLDTFRKRHYIKFSTGQGFVYDPPENIPLESFFPLDQEEPPNKRAKTRRKKKDKVNKRVDLTIQEKVLLIQQSEGKSQRQLAGIFGVGKSQVHSILRRKEEILEAFNTTGKGSMKRMNNRAETDDVNRLTWQWFQEVSLSSDVQLTGVVVQAKAREIAKQLGREDFKASNGWLDSFRRRNNIVTNDQKHLVICDEKDILAWKDNLSEYTKEYDARDVFCVSEIPLFYTSMPEPIIEAAKYQIKKKMQTQCVSVVLCCNILGEFQTPVVIGKQTPDRATLKIPEDLPVHWRWSSITWSTVEFFTEWIASLDQKMGEQDRKIVLFVDRAPPDATEILLENVQLVCPPTYSSRLQPLSHGVLESFKQKYLKQMLSALVKQTANVNENISKVLSYVSVLDACTWISQAVVDVEPATVAKAFNDCGFSFGYVSPDMPQCEEDEEYAILIKKVIDSFARKPLSFYMGTRSEEASPADPLSIDCNQSGIDSNADSQRFNAASSDNPEDVSSASRENSSDEGIDESEDNDDDNDGDDDDDNEDKDPSVDFSLDKFSPLGRSLYKSSRRATLEKNKNTSEESSSGSQSKFRNHVLSKIKTEGEDEGSIELRTDDKLDSHTEGQRTAGHRSDSHVSETQIPTLTTREDAMKAAEALRQYCVDNKLLHVVDKMKAVIEEL